MSKVTVFADGAADIPQELVDELGIHVIPMKVQIGNTTYTAGVDLTTEEFYRLLPTSDSLPTTSQPTPNDFHEAYQKAIAEGATQILSIHLSSAMSGTCQSAQIAKTMIEDENVEITIVDSRSVSFGFGSIVVAAARAAKEGKNLQECLEVVKHYQEKQQIYALLDTLEYLQKGGRIGKVSAVVGSLLSIKPILGISSEGVLYPRDKVRGKKKAKQKIFHMIQEDIPAGPVSLGVFHSNNREEAERFLEEIQKLEGYEWKDMVIAEIGPVVGTHTGPGAVAAVMIPLS